MLDMGATSTTMVNGKNLTNVNNTFSINNGGGRQDANTENTPSFTDTVDQRSQKNDDATGSIGVGVGIGGDGNGKGGAVRKSEGINDFFDKVKNMDLKSVTGYVLIGSLILGILSFFTILRRKKKSRKKAK